MELENKNVKDYEKIDAIEQYGHRPNLEIVRVPFIVENTNKIAIDVAKVLNVELSENQISTIHRLQSLKHDDNNSQQTSQIRYSSKFNSILQESILESKTKSKRKFNFFLDF